MINYCLVQAVSIYQDVGGCNLYLLISSLLHQWRWLIHEVKLSLMTSCFMLQLPLGISNHHEARYYYWGYKCTGIYSNWFAVQNYLVMTSWHYHFYILPNFHSPQISSSSHMSSSLSCVSTTSTFLSNRLLILSILSRYFPTHVCPKVNSAAIFPSRWGDRPLGKLLPSLCREKSTGWLGQSDFSGGPVEAAVC